MSLQTLLLKSLVNFAIKDEAESLCFDAQGVKTSPVNLSSAEMGA